MDNTPSAGPTINPPQKPSINIVGVGNAGLAALDCLGSRHMDSIELIGIDTDSKALAGCSAANKILLENQRLRGLGSGGDPERGRQLAEEDISKLKPLFQGVSAAFIVAGFGGGAGTGIAPVLARAAKECGALTLALITTPFDCEGSRRAGIAAEGLDLLKPATDAIICLPNQKILKLIDEQTSIIDTFKTSNALVADGVQGICRLLAHKGLIEIHFADFCKLLRDSHADSALGFAEASGPERCQQVIEKLLAHPLLDKGDVFAHSDAILVSLLGGPDLTMAHVNRVMEQIQSRSEKATVMMGAAIDETFRERLAVTVIVARTDPGFEADDARSNGASADELEKQLITSTPPRRRASRFVAPAPTLPPEKMATMLARQRSGTRPRKTLPKMRQTQLPLEIISKGRFDKSEPTIHQGEDLDVPTYIRRGIALN